MNAEDVMAHTRPYSGSAPGTGSGAARECGCRPVIAGICAVHDSGFDFPSGIVCENRTRSIVADSRIFIRCVCSLFRGLHGQFSQENHAGF
ncbi:hypothetical protein ASZ90_009901 [hydrocarbon metagenome]|uniref:Uncharacterized protein n=1 Tax=hydrocarbon metagenome TaxID=938273 RepID=A0A0W8FHL4_9ZZZZ